LSGDRARARREGGGAGPRDREDARGARRRADGRGNGDHDGDRAPPRRSLPRRECAQGPLAPEQATAGRGRAPELGYSPWARSRGVAVAQDSADRERRHWLALQRAGALRARRCTDALRAGEAVERVLAHLPDGPGEAWIERADACLVELGGVLLWWGSPIYPP